MRKSEKTWPVGSKRANLDPRGERERERRTQIRYLNAQAMELDNLNLNHHLAVTEPLCVSASLSVK